MEEQYALLCALCKIYDNYVTPMNTSVSCWKCWTEDSNTFFVGISVTQFTGPKKFIVFYVPSHWWPLFNLIQLDKPEGIPEVDRKAFLMNL